MVTAVKLVLAGMMFGENVLLHCRQGKHRSGALCVIMLALLLGCSIAAAVDLYMSKRQDLYQRDKRIVEKIARRKGLDELLEKLRRQTWCQEACLNILNRVWAQKLSNVPQPKSRPKSRPPSARRDIFLPLQPESRPQPKTPPKSRPPSSASSVQNPQCLECSTTITEILKITPAVVFTQLWLDEDSGVSLLR